MIGVLMNIIGLSNIFFGFSGFGVVAPVFSAIVLAVLGTFGVSSNFVMRETRHGAEGIKKINGAILINFVMFLVISFILYGVGLLVGSFF